VTLASARTEGDHRVLGAGQGETFSDGIRSALDFYGRLLPSQGMELSAAAAAAHPYIDAARRALPGLVEEIEGLALGAGISNEEAFLLNCLEELTSTEACTTMAHGPFLLHAEQWYEGHSAIGVVTATPDEGPSFVSPTGVGFLPAVGMNAAGVAQGIDSLTADDDRIGIPRVLVSRHSLGAPSLNASLRAARLEDRAGGYAHTFVTSAGSSILETSATRAQALLGERAHTNHYLSAALKRSEVGSSGSRARLRRARRLLVESPPKDLHDCARLLADHAGRPDAICAHGEGLDGSCTIFGMACDSSTGRMIVSDGRPCEGRWEEFVVPHFGARESRRVG
jgi:isopenicillin-N N-acyltransferase-like protein